MVKTLIRRLNAERGFTLIELLITLIILGILMAVAVPAYLSFKGRAEAGAAATNIRVMVPAIEAYKSDAAPGNGYTGMTIGGVTGLRTVYDFELTEWDAVSGTGVTILSADATTYCVKSVQNGATYYKAGPSGEIVQAPACT